MKTLSILGMDRKEFTEEVSEKLYETVTFLSNDRTRLADILYVVMVGPTASFDIIIDSEGNVMQTYEEVVEAGRKYLIEEAGYSKKELEVN